MNETEYLKSICDDIYAITKIKTVFYDADMNLLYGRHDTMSDFCMHVRENDVLHNRCISCDREGFRHCRESGDIYIYHCHMGLIEVIAPITESGNVIGYIQFGQLSDEADKRTCAAIVKKSDLLNDKDKALKMLHALPITDQTTIRASARLISMCASYVRLHNIIRSQKKGITDRIDEYISSHLASATLGMAEICSVFGISRATLYNYSKESFGMGISDHIRQKRIDKAIEMLKRDKKTVARIAEEVGVYDANYLTKLIKKRTGMTASRYKKSSGDTEAHD